MTAPQGSVALALRLEGLKGNEDAMRRRRQESALLEFAGFIPALPV
jgi:hypothetical protein